MSDLPEFDPSFLFVFGKGRAGGEGGVKVADTYIFFKGNLYQATILDAYAYAS